MHPKSLTVQVDLASLNDNISYIEFLSKFKPQVVLKNELTLAGENKETSLYRWSSEAGNLNPGQGSQMYQTSKVACSPRVSFFRLFDAP